MGSRKSAGGVFVVAFRKDLGLEGWKIPDGEYSEAALLHEQASGAYWKRHGIDPRKGLVAALLPPVEKEEKAVADRPRRYRGTARAA